MLFAVLMMLTPFAVSSSQNCQNNLLLGFRKDPVSFINYVSNTGSLGGAGKMDECNLSPDAQFCIVSLVVAEAPILWGVCVPQNCSAKDLAELISKLPNVKVSKTQCGFPAVEVGWGGILVACVIGCLVLAGLSTTLFAVLQSHREVKQGKEVEETGALLAVNDIARSAKPDDTANLWMRSFDWRHGIKQLFAPTPLSLRAFDGVRVISMTWICFGHSLTFFRGVFDNPRTLQAALPAGQWGWLFTLVALSL
jgi:hypothetical protein